MRLITKIILSNLALHDLPTEDRNALISAITEKTGGLPIKTVIRIGINEEGNEVLYINEVEVDEEKRRKLAIVAESLLSNQAYQLVHDAVAFNAVNVGLHEGFTNEQLSFSKSAIWYGQKEREFLKTLAGID